MTGIHRLAELPADGLAELLAASEAEGYRFVRRVVDEWRSGANRFDAPGEGLYAAEIDGAVAGICGLMSDPYLDDGAVGRLRNLYVLPTRRGRGLGRALTDAVVAAAARRFRVLHLRASGPESARLYVRAGFAPVAGDPRCTHRIDFHGAAATRLA